MSTASRRRGQVFRLRICFLVIAFVLSLFAARLFQLQGIDANAYAARAVAEGSSTVDLHAARGEIVDRNGTPLATSLDAVSISADPSMTAKKAPQIATVLVDVLGVDYFETLDKLRKPKSRFVYLARKVPTWEADRAQAELRKAKLAGVFTEPDSLRTYPGDTLAANLIGLVGSDGKGSAGLERQFEKKLSGKDGKATYEVSPDGERIPLADNTVVEPKVGIGVKTTIDRDLQWYADRRLAEAVKSSRSGWGAAITMDVKTGQILQLSQLPTFNANKPSSISGEDINARGVQNVYEPGSVQKVVTMAALADKGLITPTTKIKVPAKLDIDDFEIGDAWDHGTIKLTATGVIAKSSNLGTVLASQRMSDKQMYAYLKKFGYGSKTGIELPGESKGILKKPELWSRANHATIAFGQGISVTSMQMMGAVGAIANGGTYVQPNLVSGYVAADGSQTAAPAPQTRRVVSNASASMVTTMMEAVVRDGGTAPKAQIPGYRVAGKTGTAWRVDPDTGRYVRGENTVSFMGFAPADKPRFVTYVVLDNPRSSASGGGSAAPVFRDIMSSALQRYGVPPTGVRPTKPPLQW